MALTTDLSRIYAGVPLNGAAASVTSNSREHWEPRPVLPHGQEHWENPPSCISPSRYPRTEGFADLRGTRMGRFVVVGFLGRANKNKRATWLVRCTCGHYEARTARAIEANQDPDHCCANCHYQQRLRDGRLPRAAEAR